MQLFVVLPLHGIQFCPNTYNKEEIFPRDSPFVTILIGKTNCYNTVNFLLLLDA